MHEQSIGKQFSLKEILLVVIAVSIFTLAGIIHQKNPKPKILVTKQDSALNINRNILQTLNLGNKRLLSDLLWIQTLLEGDEEHYSKLDLNSWMYLRFISISDLDPLFYENYAFGGMYLSIVKDDLLGAAEIYERGLRYYPDDYTLNYNAGYNYALELGENEKGLKYLERIKFHSKAPKFLPSIVEKLRYEITQDSSTAMLFLEETLNQSKDESIKQKIKSEIYALKAETDLACLNSNKNKCFKTDAEGIPYFKNSYGEWVSRKNFKKFKLGRKKRI